MEKYLWIIGGNPRAIITAQNTEQAIRKAIAIRISEDELLEKTLGLINNHDKAKEAIEQFSRRDMLVNIRVDELDAEPYTGDIAELL